MKMLERAAARLLAIAACAMLLVQPALAQTPLVTPNPNRTGLPSAAAFTGDEWMDFRQNGQRVTLPVTTSFAQMGMANVGDRVQAPTVAPSYAAGGAGALTGTYGYTTTFVTALGETAPNPWLPTQVALTAQQMALTGIPTGPTGTIARKVYRTKASAVDPKDYYLDATINDNTTTTLTDNVADGSLGAPVNWAPTNRGYFTDGVTTFAKFGDQSTAFGQGASAANGGYANAAFGYQALYANTSGRRNVANGIYSLTACASCYANVGVGAHSGAAITTQNDDVFVGVYAGLSFAGNFATIVGSHAAGGTTGSGNDRIVALGYGTLQSLASGAVGDIGIGYLAGQFANASNQVFIDPSGNTRANIAAEQDAGTIYCLGAATASAQECRLNGAVRLGAGGTTLALLIANNTCVAGRGGFRATITDSTVAYTSANIGATAAGGGTNTAPVFCNATSAAAGSWVIG